MKRRKISVPVRVVIFLLGILVLSAAFISIHFMKPPAFFHGILMGLGVGIMIPALILHNRIIFDPGHKDHLTK